MLSQNWSSQKNTFTDSWLDENKDFVGKETMIQNWFCHLLFFIKPIETKFVLFWQGHWKYFNGKWLERSCWVLSLRIFIKDIHSWCPGKRLRFISEDLSEDLLRFNTKRKRYNVGELEIAFIFNPHLGLLFTLNTFVTRATPFPLKRVFFTIYLTIWFFF